MRTDRTSRILIVDDHPAVREGLACRIAEEPDMEVCGEAAGVAEALRLVASEAPDAAVVDISLDRGDGLDLIRRLRGRGHHARLLVWSMFPEELYAERSLRAGAMGYINKQGATSGIVSAIREILSDRISLSPAMTDRLLHKGCMGDPATGQDPTRLLTDRELEAYRLIGEGCSAPQIAAQMHLSVHTVETYWQRIRTKLGLRTAADLFRSALGWLVGQSGAARPAPGADPPPSQEVGGSGSPGRALLWLRE